MRRLMSASVAAGLVFTFAIADAGCKHRKRPAQQLENDPLVASMISMGDPRAEVQLRGGFYPVEANAWRWTRQVFTVALSPPARAKQNGARVVLRFTLPEVIVQNLKSVSLSASIDNFKLDPETYTKPGEYSYTRDVPAQYLQSAVVGVQFSLDKVLPPSSQDVRELGVIALEAGLIAK